MYRLYIKKNEIEIRVNDEKLEYKMPPILNAPFFYEVGKVKNEKKIKWIKDINFKYGKSKKITGFVGIFDEGKIGFSKTKYAGFNLFRRNRLIKGVGENEGFRPPSIFGDIKSHRYYRIFGELHLDDQEVSHTKDEFLWDDSEFYEFLEKLKNSIQKEPVNIYHQASNFRLERRSRDLKIQTSEGLDGAIKLAPTALKILQENIIPRQIEAPKEKPKPPKDKDVRRKQLKYNGFTWNFEIILNYDKNERDWIQVYEKGNKTKDITITIAMGMGFTQQYFGSAPEDTISVDNQNSKHWDPNQEGQRLKEFIFLKKKENPSLDENVISDQSSQILSLCINPSLNIEKLRSTGLVIGQVQSGKTLSMTAVSAMAGDNGYGIVIVMSGSVSPLSNQTAKRLVSDLKSRKIEKIINNPKDNWSSHDTQNVRNFIDNFNNPSIPKERQKTLLIVTHKNPAKIRKLTEIFANEHNSIKDIPTLIIDDECDHHSLNSKDYLNAVEKLTDKQREKNDEIYKVIEGDTWEKLSEEFGVDIDNLKQINNVYGNDEPKIESWILTEEIETKTFSTIDELRSAFDLHTYLGYTATPQALTVIDQVNKLKPDFVHTLPAGNGYTGLDHFFPQSKDKFSHENSIYINDLEDNLNETISDNYKPESFITAVHIFLIGVAVGIMKKEDTETNNNRSMIIHPHNETDAHVRFHGYTQGVLDDLKNGLSLNPLDNAYKETKEHLKKSYDILKNKNSPKDLPDFNEELIENIKFAATDTLLLEFNARESRIEEVNWDDKYSVILVGGVGLERGYTVKGLTVSYLSRSAGGRQKDTLLQRARFFGYHKKYQDYIQIYLSKDIQKDYQTISQSNKNLFNSINDFKKENPNSSFKNWVPTYIATNTAKLNLTRKGLQRRNKITNYGSNHPLINRCNHLLDDNELRINQELYKLLLDKSSNTLKHLEDFENLKPEYKEWAANRNIHLSTGMNMKNLYELITQLKFHSSEWKEFLTGTTNFELYAKSEDENINSRICPIFFMNYNSNDDKERTRKNLKNSFKINPHTGKNTNYNRFDQRTYNLFPGERYIHYDFLTGEVAPGDEKNIGKNYASIQIYNFDKVTCKGKVTENVPYFNIYPASDLWVDITRVE